MAWAGTGSVVVRGVLRDGWGRHLHALRDVVYPV